MEWIGSREVLGSCRDGGDCATGTTSLHWDIMIVEHEDMFLHIFTWTTNSASNHVGEPIQLRSLVFEKLG